MKKPNTPPGTIVIRHRPPLRSPFPSGAGSAAELLSEQRFRLEASGMSDRGRSFIPVAGELHYSRVPRSRWRRRLEQMKAGGLTAVASYVIWIHHESERGAIDFGGDRDLRAFVELCDEVGLAVVLRLGPWVHGETRNGGLPDWVQHSGCTIRTDDPAYLDLVRQWFRAIAGEVADLCVRGDIVMAIQIENELYDQPQHLLTLKRMAISEGLLAPVYVATGWGGAQLPPGELLPVFGGYGDGFWVDADAGWDDGFREHFFFSHRWDDPGIGADLRAVDLASTAPAEPEYSGFPPATCELGGGMATAYHRRPLLNGLDIAAVAHTKIGNGSIWQGYYMYAGGQNPAGTGPMQESHASEYPNDMPRWDYDFHAPIGSGGTLADSYRHLRRQHTFLLSFGDQLAQMASSLPDERPSDVLDRRTLRWALRSDGAAGFLFLNWHQPDDALPQHPPTRFRVELAEEEMIEFPGSPIIIPEGTLAHWPVNFNVNGVIVKWATASALTLLPGSIPTLVLTAEKGIVPQICFSQGTMVHAGDGARVVADTITVDSARPVSFEATNVEGTLRVLVLPFEAGLDSWILDVPDRTLAHCVDPLWQSNGTVEGESIGAASVRVFRPERGHFEKITVSSSSAAIDRPAVLTSLLGEAGAVPPSYGTFSGRASAPPDDAFEAAARFRLVLPDGESLTQVRRELVIDWEGDVARLFVDGVPVADRFWDGTVWSIDSSTLLPEADIELRILPLHPDAAIHLPAHANARRQASIEPLCALRSVEMRAWTQWTAAAGFEPTP